MKLNIEQEHISSSISGLAPAVAAEKMKPLFESLADEDTDLLEELMRDIVETPVGFIHGVGRGFSTKFYIRLSALLKERGCVVPAESFWPSSLKKAKDYERVGEEDTLTEGRNRAERRANASRARKLARSAR